MNPGEEKLSETLKKGLDEVLEYLRRRYERGDKDVLLYAAHLCLAIDDLTSPLWVKAAFHEAFSKYQSCEAKRLEDAFGIHRPKNWRQDTAKQQYEKRWPIYKRCLELHEKEGRGISNDLFEDVAREFGTNRRQVSVYYYSAKYRMTDSTLGSNKRNKRLTRQMSMHKTS